MIKYGCNTYIVKNCNKNSEITKIIWNSNEVVKVRDLDSARKI